MSQHRALRVVAIETPGLGDRSYVAADGLAALVVDPQRDIDRVRAALDELGVPLTHVLETHIHNDYVSGGLELARGAGADYVLAAAEPVGFPRHGVRDGDELTVGAMTVRVVHTPGHTPQHVSYAIAAGDGPGALFTGGSLLYGTVGRTDLVGAEHTAALARAQHGSARRLLALPPATSVHPTHGFGSFCASGAGSGATSSTVGEERAVNAAASDDADTFVSDLLAGLTPYPRYYGQMAPLNRAGPPPLDLSPPPEVDAAELARRVAAGEWVVDVRGRRAFAARHLPGTVNIELSDGLATYLGWVAPWGRPITLVGDTVDELAAAQRALARIGIDRLAGRGAGTRGWSAPQSYEVAEFADLARHWHAEPTVLDVRAEHEWRDGHLDGATHLPLPELEARLGELSPDPLWVHCQSGFRAAIAASLLDRASHPVVLVDDDFTAAAAVGLPLTH